MKILLITDIHSDYSAAKAAYFQEKPDLVLDCGDHEKIINLFDNTPHYYVHGNHEPVYIDLSESKMSLPHKINTSEIYSYKKGADKICFTGVGGNYSLKRQDKSVNHKDISNLKKIPSGTLDILLLHESPLNVSEKQREYGLAQEVINEIKKIQPEYIFCGHTGSYSEKTIGNSKIVNLDDMGKGYGILEVENNKLNFVPKISRFG